MRLRLSVAVMGVFLAVGCAGTDPSSSCPTDMAALPAGTYTMGSGGSPVTVAAFCLDVTEVTTTAYQTCVQGGSCTAAGTDYASCTYGHAALGDHPINCVDWNQATAYCAAVGKRLPTEEEWEWAARGAELGTTYPWGNDLPGAQACWNLTSNGSTCAVGAFPSGDNPQGIHDLAGNVWEWTSSTYSGSGSSRVHKGGGWNYLAPEDLRAAVRHGGDPSFQIFDLGFRCARTR